MTKKNDTSGIVKASDPEDYGRLLEKAEKDRPTRFIVLKETGFVVEVIVRKAVEVLDIWELIDVDQTVFVDPDASEAEKSMAGMKLLKGQVKILDHAIKAGWVRAPKMFPSDYEPEEGEKGLPVMNLSREDRQSLVRAFTNVAEEDEAVKQVDSFHEDQGGETRGPDSPEEEPAGD